MKVLVPEANNKVKRFLSKFKKTNNIADESQLGALKTQLEKESAKAITGFKARYQKEPSKGGSKGARTPRRGKTKRQNRSIRKKTRRFF